MIVEGTCAACGEDVRRCYGESQGPPSVLFCSNPCRIEASKKNKLIKQCVVCGDDFAISASNDRRYVTCGPECKRQHKEGDRNGNWRGGFQGYRGKEARSGKVRRWRNAVLERDRHRCVRCGTDENLHADHIKQWSLYSELRYEVSNGRTLCKKCHQKTYREYKAERKKREAEGYIRQLIPREPIAKTCPGCHIVFTTENDGRDFCTERCQRNTAARRLRATRKQKGLCRDCGLPNPRVPLGRCSSCQEKSSPRAA